MLIDKNPMENYKSMLETEKNDWDSFELDETKMNTINVLFNVISDSDLNYVCIKLECNMCSLICY